MSEKNYRVTHPVTPIFTNDLKKGDRVLLRNGWEADMWDNMKGQTRVALVYGFETEAGSVYSHDIFAVKRDDKWLLVKHTPKQDQLRTSVARMGF
jgi:hypothetical protein